MGFTRRSKLRAFRLRGFSAEEMGTTLTPLETSVGRDARETKHEDARQSGRHEKTLKPMKTSIEKVNTLKQY